MPRAYHIALVCDPAFNKRIGPRHLTAVSAALQKQIIRDFEPIWEIDATIDPFFNLQDVPLGYWPIIVRDDIDTPDAAGVHEDHMGQPFALVKAGPLWSLTASHECLEMLVDPFGNRTVAGKVPQEVSGDRSTVVEYLLEVCDPCEYPRFAYEVDGIPVSDFYTPHYFDHQKIDGVRYDMTGNISRPLQVLTNGYLSWHNSADQRWWQMRGFGPNPFVPAPLKEATEDDCNMRPIIDALTPTPLERASLTADEGGGPEVDPTEMFLGARSVINGEGGGPIVKPKPSGEGGGPIVDPERREEGGGPIVRAHASREMVNDAKKLQEQIEEIIKKKKPGNSKPRKPRKK